MTIHWVQVLLGFLAGTFLGGTAMSFVMGLFGRGSTSRPGGATG